MFANQYVTCIILKKRGEGSLLEHRGLSGSVGYLSDK